MFPLGQKKEEKRKKKKKRLDLQFYYSVLKKGRERDWVWGCNSFKRGYEVFESYCTLISLHFTFDTLWPFHAFLKGFFALWLKFLSLLAGFGPEPISSEVAPFPLLSHCWWNKWVPTIFNSFPALNVLARQCHRLWEREPEDTLNGPLERVYDLLVIRGLS